MPRSSAFAALRRRPPALVWTLALLASPSLADERVGRLVDALGAARAAARDVAQAELARLLRGEEQISDLVDAVDGAPVEALRRVAVTLGEDESLLGLAVGLAGSGEADAARVGRWAIEAQLVRWSATAFDEPSVAAYDPPRQRVLFPRSWRERATFRLSLDPDDGGGVAAFDRLDRYGLGPAPIVVDPRLAERMVRRPAPDVLTLRVDGPWHEVLEALCSIHDAAYQLQGYAYPEQLLADPEDDGPSAPSLAWIHVVARGTSENAPVGVDLRRSGASFIADWCLEVRREGNLVRQCAAARALAALDWTAAVLWFEDRWLATGDVVALEGLLASASRGRVAPSLQQAGSVRKVLAVIDEEAREVAATRA
ncbi:MAG: hypothetical protein AAGA20_04800, partial [Planctomycetota bacterium]